MILSEAKDLCISEAEDRIISPRPNCRICQPEQRIRIFVLQHQPRHHLAQRGAMLEPVPRASSQQPDIFVSGMPVDDEVIVRTVLVLADARLQQGRIFQRGKAEGDIVADRLEPLGADCSFALTSDRIPGRECRRRL